MDTFLSLSHCVSLTVFVFVFFVSLPLSSTWREDRYCGGFYISSYDASPHTGYKSPCPKLRQELLYVWPLSLCEVYTMT